MLHYGAVGNQEPVLMLTGTMGLPQGCCAPQVGTDSGQAGEQAGVEVSVPCLSSNEIHDTNTCTPGLLCGSAQMGARVHQAYKSWRDEEGMEIVV